VISLHYGPLFFFPAVLDFGNAGPEEAKNLAGQKASALIQIRLALSSLEKSRLLVKEKM